MLFLDGTWLAKTANIVATLGTPELLSVYRDPNASNYVGWGYPSVLRASQDAPCRMIYQGYSTPKFVLMAESADCIHFRASESLPGGGNLLFESDAEQSFVFDDPDAATPAERFNLLLGNGSRAVSADALHWNLAGRWQDKGIDPGFSVFRRDGRLVVESRPPNLRDDKHGGTAAQCAAVGGCGRHVGLNAGDSWTQLGRQDPIRCLPVDRSYNNSDQIYGMPTFAYDDLYISFLWRYHCHPEPGKDGSTCFRGGNNSAELAFSYNGPCSHAHGPLHAIPFERIPSTPINSLCSAAPHPQATTSAGLSGCLERPRRTRRHCSATDRQARRRSGRCIPILSCAPRPADRPGGFSYTPAPARTSTATRARAGAPC